MMMPHCVSKYMLILLYIVCALPIDLLYPVLKFFDEEKSRSQKTCNCVCGASISTLRKMPSFLNSLRQILTSKHPHDFSHSGKYFDGEFVRCNLITLL
jgi:hypothetical protein